MSSGKKIAGRWAGTFFAEFGLCPMNPSSGLRLFCEAQRVPSPVLRTASGQAGRKRSLWAKIADMGQ
jgi:hypothetical protein